MRCCGEQRARCCAELRSEWTRSRTRSAARGRCRARRDLTDHRPGEADGDTDAGQRATRDGLSALAGVAPMRDTAASISRHSLRGRRERPALRSFEARLAGIDELYAALLLMTATVPPAPGEHATRLHTLAPAVAELARALEVVAEQPTEAEAHPRAHAHAAAAACAARRPRRRRPGR